MTQLEGLKVFVSERLHAAASEIFVAIEKTITDYEEEASRLKEENHRHRSLLDMILKAQIPQTNAGNSDKSPPAAASPAASDKSPASRDGENSRSSSDLQFVFTSRTDFLKFKSKGNCPYCFKSAPSTETHLMKKHYLFAVHFSEDGTEKFVVPCMCKDRIQDRSHWHCPYCRKIIHRKCNFEKHIVKQHDYALLQQSQDAEISQPSVSAIEEEAPLSLDPWRKQGGSLNQEDQRTTLLLQVKEEEEQEIWRPVSHPESQNSEHLQIKGEQTETANSQMGEQSLEGDRAKDSAFVIVYPNEINTVGSSKGHPPPNHLAQPLEGRPDGGYQHTTEDGAVIDSESSNTKEWTNHAPCSSLKAVNSKKKNKMKSSLTALIKKSTQLPASQNLTGSHSCKACGKTFHYMYTLRTHVQTHTVDKILICGLCGKHLKSSQSLVQHLQSHTKRNKCGICGKQFSNTLRLNRHLRFHRPKGSNVISSD